MSLPEKRTGPVTTPGRFQSPAASEVSGIRIPETSLARCVLCWQKAPRAYHTSQFCARCHGDLIDGFHRRHEAALRLTPIGAGPRDPLLGVAA